MESNISIHRAEFDDMRHWLPIELGQWDDSNSVNTDSEFESELQLFCQILELINGFEFDKALMKIHENIEQTNFKCAIYLLAARIKFLKDDYQGALSSAIKAWEADPNSDVLASFVSEMKKICSALLSKNSDHTQTLIDVEDLRLFNSYLSNVLHSTHSSEVNPQYGHQPDSQNQVKNYCLDKDGKKVGAGRSDDYLVFGSELKNSAESLVAALKHVDVKILNLKHREDRWEAIQQHLTDLKFPNVEDCRFDAIYVEEYGELACSRSHLKLMVEYLCESEKPYLMVLEDDFRFTVQPDIIAQTLEWFLSNEKIDVFMMNCSNFVLESDAQNISKTEEYKSKRVLLSSSMAGFVVRRRHVSELIKVLLESINAHENLRHVYENVCKSGKKASLRSVLDMICNDRVWIKLQAAHHYHTVVPSVGMTVPSFSDIEKCHVNYERMENR